MTLHNLRRVQSLLALCATLVLAPGLWGQEASDSSVPTDWDAVTKAATELLLPAVEDGLTVGLVVGIVRGSESRVLALGETRLGSGQGPDADSIYEIGSVSKVFTGLLLADAATRGIVELDDTVEDLLDGVVEVPTFADQPVQLWHLSTHTSGLPRMPSNMARANPEDPYADYTVKEMYDALEGCDLERAPGERYAYSNLAVGLLGNLLVREQDEAAGYAGLLRKRITTPLGLEHTAILLTPWMTEHLVPGYDVDQNPKQNWDLPAFAGAGGIRSNMSDMLRFADACLHPEPGPLAQAMELSMEIRHREAGGVVMGLGWHVGSNGSTRWHNGQTGGYHTYFALWPEGDVAVVLLSNTTSGLLDLFADNVLLLMMGRKPRELQYKKALPLDLEASEEYVGEYKLGPLARLTVTLNEKRMMAQMTFQSQIRIYPSGPDRFFYRAVEAELLFQRDESGAVVGVEILQGGRTTKGKRE
ncbi:MAG: D-alanyl-D-alanine-carboxypeptidase/D-alanyl-D-alanine-endopeptidase [Planctomycetota bacterium]|jgi:D-alanyl-D-alanine-carboxypeptidase/D-alanyl-D-alanine-endopeptidase